MHSIHVSEFAQTLQNGTSHSMFKTVNKVLYYLQFNRLNTVRLCGWSLKIKPGFHYLECVSRVAIVYQRIHSLMTFFSFLWLWKNEAIRFHSFERVLFVFLLCGIKDCFVANCYSGLSGKPALKIITHWRSISHWFYCWLCWSVVVDTWCSSSRWMWIGTTRNSPRILHILCASGAGGRSRISCN